MGALGVLRTLDLLNQAQLRQRIKKHSRPDRCLLKQGRTGLSM